MAGCGCPNSWRSYSRDGCLSVGSLGNLLAALVPGTTTDSGSGCGVSDEERGQDKPAPAGGGESV